MRRSRHYWGERERERERDSTTRFFTEQKARDANLANLLAGCIHLDAFHSHPRVPLRRLFATPRARRCTIVSSRVVLRVKCVEIEGRKKTKAIARDAPGAGFGANTPVSLSNIHDLGAFKRFKCFFGPRTMLRCLLLRALLLGSFSFSFFLFFLCLESSRGRVFPRQKKTTKKKSQKSLPDSST